MIATVELFPNEKLAGDVETLRQMFFDRGDALKYTRGLEMKAWFNSPTLGQFGACVLWNNADALNEFRKTDDTAALKERWGVEPVVMDFDVYQLLRRDQLTRY